MGRRRGVGAGRGWTGDLSHTRALLQATIACAVIVLKAWRPETEPPPVDCCMWGPRLSLSEIFLSFLWLVGCLCSRGEGQYERSKEEGKHYRGTVHCDPSLYCGSSIFIFFFMFSERPLSLSCVESKNGNAVEFTSLLILATGSWPENTSSNFCLYWSSCVFPLLLFLSPALQGTCRLFGCLNRPSVFYFHYH